MFVKVRVPATSANLGPGFDVAGLAVTLYNTFTFELLDEGLEILGCPEQFANKDNLTYRAFEEGARYVGLDYKGLRITNEGDVPYTRGLGSSSTCIVAGIVVGEYAVSSGWFNTESLLYMAVVTVGTYSQASFEMGYAMKFERLLLLVLTQILGIWGFIGGIVLITVGMLLIKTLSGRNYLYPVVPFNLKGFTELFMRYPMK